MTQRLPQPSQGIRELARGLRNILSASHKSKRLLRLRSSLALQRE
jgi:hypothetical protein